MTYTKGPWLTEPDDDFEPWTTLISTPNVDIATAWGGYNAAEADASLIAAAPELFEALVAVEEYMAFRATEVKEPYPLMKVRAALSRARGEV